MQARLSLPTLARRTLVATAALAIAATPLASAAEASITKPFKANSTLTLSPGIKFQVGTMKTSGGHPQSVRVVTVQPKRDEVRLKALLSNNKVVKREVVGRIASLNSRTGFRPTAAINGDMSMRNRVDAYAAPHSMAVSSGELMVGQACVRPALGVDAAGEAHINNVRAHVSVIPPGKTMPKQIHKVNTHRNDGLVVLFTKRFASSTQTPYGGVEVVLDLEGKLQPSGTQKVRVLKVRKGGGNTVLKAGQAVLSVKNPSQKWVYQLRVGQQFQLRTQVVRMVDKPCGGTLVEAPGWSQIMEAQGGNYYTLRQASIAAPSRATYAPGAQRHPRTGIGLKANGEVLMVTVDGRRTASHGVTLAEMGQLMKSLGARHALNLDGGGSTVMARHKAGTGRFEVANRPSDGKQRPATQGFAAFRVTLPE